MRPISRGSRVRQPSQHLDDSPDQIIMDQSPRLSDFDTVNDSSMKLPPGGGQSFLVDFKNDKVPKDMTTAAPISPLLVELNSSADDMVFGMTQGHKNSPAQLN